MKSQKVLSYTCFILLFLSVLPLLFVGFYNHPTGDDILYGLDAHLTFQKTHSLFLTIKSAWAGVVSDYTRWQGTFSALLIMRLQPTVFHENLYFLTPFIVIGFLGIGIFLFIYEIGNYILKLNKYEFFGISSLIMFLCLQWVISPGEAFYWFNGSVYYSGTFGLLLISWGLICKYMFVPSKKIFFLLCFLEIIIGGSNYLTLLWSLIILSILCIVLLIFQRKKFVPIFSLTVIQLCCFIISALAPGNKVRSDSLGTSLTAYRAIRESLDQGMAFYRVWLNGWWILGAILLSFFVVPAIRRLNYNFYFPITFSCFMFGFFSALSCPSFYAQGNAGPARALNLSSYGFILTSYITLFYVLGFIIKFINKRIFDTQVIQKFGCIKTVVIPIFFCLLLIQINIGINDHTLSLFSTSQAIRDIYSGTIFRYHDEYLQRIEYLKNTPEQDIILDPYTNRPLTVYVGDYAGFKEQGSNVAFAAWYNKDSIIVNYNGEP